jgi:hypothetical protein
MIRRGTNLEDQFRNYGQISLRQRSRRDSIITVECNVGPAYRVGIVFCDNAGVIDDKMT